MVQRPSGIDVFTAPDGKTYYNDGGPGGGGPSTVPKAGDLNGVTEALCRFQEHMGFPLVQGPDDPNDITDDDYQLLTKAILRAATGSENLLLNPQLRVAQEGIGPWPAIGMTPEHLCDMWQAVGDAGAGTGTISVTRAAKAAGSNSPWEFLVNVNGLASVKNPTIYQKIESAKTLAGRSLSVSLMGRNFGGSGTLRLRVTQVFGTGGSPSADVVAGAVDVTLTGTDETVGATFELPSVAVKTFGTNGDDYLLLEVEIFAFAGTTYISELHAVPGEVTKPFVARPIEEEIARCQRYFEKSIPLASEPRDWISEHGYSTTHHVYRANGFELACLAREFSVEKRSVPAVYWYEGIGPTGLPTSAGTEGKMTFFADGGGRESIPVDGTTGTTTKSTGFPSSFGTPPGGSSFGTAVMSTVSAHWTADARL